MNSSFPCVACYQNQDILYHGNRAARVVTLHRRGLANVGLEWLPVIYTAHCKTPVFSRKYQLWTQPSSTISRLLTEQGQTPGTEQFRAEQNYTAGFVVIKQRAECSVTRKEEKRV